MAHGVFIRNLAADTPVLNTATPFNVGNHVQARSTAGGLLYGVNSPAASSLTKLQDFKQTISGNRAFALASAINTPQNTTGSALSTANQLRVVGISGGVLKKRLRGDQVATAGNFIVAAGGGTAAGQADLSTRAATAFAVGAVSVDIRETSGTSTILVGDKINFAGDTTDYYATATTVTLDATGVATAITPPLQVAITASVAVTVTAANGKTCIFGDIPAVNSTVEIWVNDASDVITLTGGSLVAGQAYDIEAYQAMTAAAATDLIPMAKA